MTENNFADKKRVILILKIIKFADEKINLLTNRINLQKKKNKFAAKNNNFAA